MSTCLTFGYISEHILEITRQLNACTIPMLTKLLPGVTLKSILAVPQH